MACDQHDPLGVLRIGSFQDGVNIRYHGGHCHSLTYRLCEAVGLYLEAFPAVARIALKLAFDPLPSRADSVPRRNRSLVLRRNCAACLEADQLFDVSLDLMG